MYRRTNNRIIDEIKESFRQGSMMTKLIYINIAVFLAVRIFHVIFGMVVPNSSYDLFQIRFLEYLMYPNNIAGLILRPWTIFTYMFLHYGFWHLFFNMLGLYWFGRFYLNYFTGKQFLTTYILGGIAGALFTSILSYLAPGIPINVPMLGASASVMAIVIGVLMYIPNQEFRIPFIGGIKMKHIALAYIVMDVLQIPGNNAGGHIAHLGGALYGYLFALQMRRGKDLGRGFSAFFDAIVSMFKRKPKMKVTYKNQARKMSDHDYNQNKAATQKEVDVILDKIAKSGYESLTKKEKEILFKMSNKS